MLRVTVSSAAPGGSATGLLLVRETATTGGVDGLGRVRLWPESVSRWNRWEEPGSGGHSCNCGEVDGPEYPELDARGVPHAIRHATIFGALDAIRPGGGLVLVAPHDPIPLLAQIEQRWPGVFTEDYLERGPDTWRLSFVRSG